LLNGGIRFRYGKGQYLMLSLGYAFPFVGDKAVYISGSHSASIESFMNAVSTGGFSVNVGILIKLNRGSFIKN
jgi:hypothetical protein